MRGKKSNIKFKKINSRRQKIRIRFLVLAAILILPMAVFKTKTSAEHCPSLRAIFIRGSGEKRWTDTSYLEFKSTLEQKLATVDLDYEFIDLDYPAVGVGIDKLNTTLGAFFGAGEAYEFGNSVKLGARNLQALINDSGCQDTKYVLGGYSQGAMVISKTLSSLNPDRIIYAATFGDPKIYLPEGGGLFPAACRGGSLSAYRMYVPDCQAYKGLLGAHVPYEPKTFAGKVGTWCNKRDIFCSSKLNINDHLAYVSDDLYEDASRTVFDKITKTFGLENRVSSPHDTAILIDSTGSMSRMIEKYKSEARRLAEETLNTGGRVALYDYRDLNDPYTPVEHCGFEDCTLELFSQKLEQITVDGGGDDAESLLSASFSVMKQQNWKMGSTKSLVVLTDSDYVSPDRDGITLSDVVKLSKSIDPVNFYIITDAGSAAAYQTLAEETDGKVVTNFDELSLLTDYIIQRYDSLPRVEENEMVAEKPILEIVDQQILSENTLKVDFQTDGEKTLVILNDQILGMTTASTVTIAELDPAKENVLRLVPIKNDSRGDGIDLSLKTSHGASLLNPGSLIPRTPNSGRSF